MSLNDCQHLLETAVSVHNITDARVYVDFGEIVLNKHQNHLCARKAFEIALTFAESIDHNELSDFYYCLGWCHRALGDTKIAIQMVNKSLAYDNSNQYSYLMLGLLLVNATDFKGASTMFEKVLGIDETNIDASSQLSMLLLFHSDQFAIERAKKIFYKIRRVLKDDFKFQYDFGKIVMEKYQDLQFAKIIFSYIRHTCKTSALQMARATTALGKIATKYQNYNEALKWFQKAINLNPKYFVPYFESTNILIDQHKDYSAATSLYLKLLEVDSTVHVAWIELENLVTTTALSLNTAISFVQHTLNSHIILQFSKILICALKKYDLANKFLLRCSLLDPNHWEVWYQLSVTQIQLKQYPLAVASLSKSIEIYPHYWHSYRALGEIYSEVFNDPVNATKMFDKAIDVFNQMGNDDQSSDDILTVAMVHLKIGLIYYSMNTELEKMRYNLETALMLHPRLSYARKILSFAMTRSFDDIDGAVTLVESGLQLDPNDRLLQGTLACFQVAANQTNQNTLTMFQKSLRDPKPMTYVYFVIYLLRNKDTMQDRSVTIQTKHDIIEHMLHQAIKLSENKPHDSKMFGICIAYHELAMFELSKQDIEASIKFEKALQMYDEGLVCKTECLYLLVGKARLLASDYFKQYDESVVLYQEAFSASNAGFDVVSNAMFNLAKLLLKFDNYVINKPEYIEYLIEEGCKKLISNYGKTLFLTLNLHWIGSFESTLLQFTTVRNINIDHSLVHRSLGLYYESINKLEHSLFHHLKSVQIQQNDTQIDDTKLIVLSHWKLGKIFSVYLNNSNDKAMDHFCKAINSHQLHSLSHLQQSELYYDFAYFLETKMNDIWNATKGYAIAIKINVYNRKANVRFDQLIEKHRCVFAQRGYDTDCTVCSRLIVHEFDNNFTTNCGHQFHKACVLKWLKKQPTCPICRSPQITLIISNQTDNQT